MKGSICHSVKSRLTLECTAAAAAAAASTDEVPHGFLYCAPYFGIYTSQLIMQTKMNIMCVT